MPQNSEVPGTYLYGSGCFFKKNCLRPKGRRGTYLLVVVLVLVLLALVLLVVLVVAAVMSLTSEHCIGESPQESSSGGVGTPQT